MALDLVAKVFHTGSMSKRSQYSQSEVSTSLIGVQAHLLDRRDDKARLQRLLRQHHYLGGVRPVGEQLFYAVTDVGGQWLGVLVFCAASRRLRGRDRWIGWSEEQRRRSCATSEYPEGSEYR